MGNFLFIAYKSSSEDYCRNHCMARYQSDFVIENMLTAERLVDFWALYSLKNMSLSGGEEGYIFHIFKDGVHIWNENYATSDDNEDEITEIYEKAMQLATTDFNKAKKLAGI